MSDTPLDKLLHKNISRQDFLKFTALSVVSLFGAFGVITELLSHAAAPYTSVEAETGTKTGLAADESDTTASAGEAVVFGSGPPENNAPPVISGTAYVSDTLSVTSGTWTGNPTSYTYQWLRSGALISGATTVSYAPTTYDVGSVLSCTVSATNASGTATATSTVTAATTAAGFFTDTFTGTALNATYWQNGYRQGESAGIAATPASNVSINGTLTLNATGTNGAYTGSGGDYKTGAISTIIPFGPYATVTVVAKMSKGVGMWPAIWFVSTSEELLPANWPEPEEHFEFDMQECPQSATGDEGTDINTVHQTYHYTPTTLVDGARVEHNTGITVALGTTVDLSADYHTYECQWNESSIVFLFDGEIKKTLTQATNPDDPATGAVDICNTKAVLFLTNQINNAAWDPSLTTSPNPTLISPNASTVFPAPMIVKSVAITAPPLAS
jgi:beta-glucanase (GH16 family)